MKESIIENILKSKGLFEELSGLVSSYKKFAYSSGSQDSSCFRPVNQSPGRLSHGSKSPDCVSPGASETIQVLDSSFKIGGLKLNGKLTAAPLAGISDNTFRIFSKAFGASLCFTEMISAYGVHFKNMETQALSYITSYERPCGIQLFGSEPDILCEAAQIMQEKADVIDINMGCPVPKVLKTGSGGMLLTDEDKIAKIISKVASCIKKPLTVKTRLGWDKNSINIDKVAGIAQENGASAIVIHARTVKQGFSGHADYSYISRVKEKLDIPVIASGDIDEPLRAMKVLRQTGCDAIMIGRALKGRQWTLPVINAAIEKAVNEGYPVVQAACNNRLQYMEPSVEFMKSFAVLYLKFMIEFKGEIRALHEFRKILAWIFKGVRSISRHKSEFFSISTKEDAVRAINRIKP